MPVLRRLLIPWLALPACACVAILSWGARSGIRPVHLLLALLAIGFSSAIYAVLVGAYRQWSQAPKPVEGALVPPEPVVLVSRGGFLTPASGLFTKESVLLFTSGRIAVTLPLERVGGVKRLRGRFLRTPYVELFAKDGRSLGRIGVESADLWARELERLLATTAEFRTP
jgi:hypothetical protein